MGFVSNFEWLNLAAVFATYLARTLGMFCGIRNQTHVANSHSALGQLFWFSGTCVFDEKMRFVTSKTPHRRVHFLARWIVRQCACVCHRVLQCVAVCCSVLQRVSACYSVLQCVAVDILSTASILPSEESMLQCVAVCRSVLQCVAMCYSVLQYLAVSCVVLQSVTMCFGLLSLIFWVEPQSYHLKRLCCSLLQYSAVCCSVLLCCAMCCSVLQCFALHCHEHFEHLLRLVIWR